MVRRKFSASKFVIVSLDLRTFFEEYPRFAEDSDDFVHCFDDWVFGADGAAGAGESYVDRLGKQLFFRSFSGIRIKMMNRNGIAINSTEDICS